MGSKKISIKEETYHRLDRLKADDESFSDVIDRLLETDEHPLSELIGLLTDNQRTPLTDHSQTFRKSVDDRFTDNRSD